ncbi:CG31681 [Drosophila busckii]|uniref:trypsin n=1 Tax=Drosophila busckii TaxID=30019 RepID=A0A0M4ESP5_DROBS|nr:trypsin alpha [Drosophila busckii]ALC40145.1 CG31681 [Drosophila busckii]
MLLKVLILLLAFSLTKSDNGRIVGGADVSIEQAPWQVSVQKYYAHHCGGVIYTKYLIITAAHCVENTQAHVLKVRAGSELHNRGGQLVAVLRILSHSEADVALLLLHAPLRRSERVQTISLAKQTPPPAAPVQAYGWGQTEREYSSMRLQRVALQIVSHKDCELAYQQTQITETMLCAAAAGKDACQGDSGGPLVSAGKLVGIVSFGYKCSHPYYPGVYVDVAKLRSWFQQVDYTVSQDSSEPFESDGD